MVKLVHFILLITDGKVDQSPTPTPHTPFSSFHYFGSSDRLLFCYMLFNLVYNRVNSQQVSGVNIDITG